MGWAVPWKADELKRERERRLGPSVILGVVGRRVSPQAESAREKEKGRQHKTERKGEETRGRGGDEEVCPRGDVGAKRTNKEKEREHNNSKRLVRT
jgi:hypothetical protein